MEKANDEEDRAIKLAELQDALARARAARTVRVYDRNEGFVWRADQGAVDDAQNELDDQLRDWKNQDILDAIDEEIDKINDLKDALDETTEAQVDALNKRKDAIAEAAEAETDKLDDLKDKWNEVVSLIGTSWDDYQEKLRAMAEFSGMTFEQLGDGIDGFKEKVIENMKSLGEVTAQIKEVTKAIDALDTDSGSGSGSGSGGSSSRRISTPDTGKLDATDEKLQKLTASAGKMAQALYNAGGVSIDTANQLQELFDAAEQAAKGHQEAADAARGYLLAANDTTTSLDSQRLAQDNYAKSLENVKQSYDETKDFIVQYVETLATQSDATEEAKQIGITALLELADQYGLSYSDIFAVLDTYRGSLTDNDAATQEKSEAIKGAVADMADKIVQDMASSSGSFDEFMEKVRAADEAVLQHCTDITATIGEMRRAYQEAAQIELEAQNSANRSSAEVKAGITKVARYASGTLGVKTAHIAITDEAGPEIKIRPASGQYSLMQRGDSVIPAQPSANLWRFGLDPDSFLQQHIRQRAIGEIEIRQPKAAGSTVVNVGDIQMYGVNDLESFGRVIHERAATVFAQEFSK